MLNDQDFRVWLAGFLSATGPNITPEQVKVIQEQLAESNKGNKPLMRC